MVELTKKTLDVQDATYTYFPLSQFEGADALPYAMRVVLENIARNAPDAQTAQTQARRLVDAATAGQMGEEVEFAPARVLFQDFTGVPVFVDFAAMRDACVQLGGGAEQINPQVPATLVIDHSVIADEYGSSGALEANMALEYERNQERYEFLKWSQGSFDNVQIVPPGQGICHQVNVEAIGSVVLANSGMVYFDTVVGTDSHTTTIGGLGVLGWGVGGIEAEAAALGQPIPMLVPRAIGVELTGTLGEGVCAMDVALTFAEMLRAEGVVGCFVECFGLGLANLTVTQRACIANMTPEYGCTCTLFPIDDQTISYLRITGRSESAVALVEAYAKEQGLWHIPEEQRTYAKVLKLDLGSVKRSLAGPARPHDRIDFACMPDQFARICDERGCKRDGAARIEIDGVEHNVRDGAVAIAAITSCTTATDPAMMVAAGLLARNAVKAGAHAAPWVKTILAPGSHATELLLSRAGLLEPLAALGFSVCGFGCMSCIGNSGPLLPQMHDIAESVELTSVLSGNRNFEGRISPDVAQNYLCSPAGVVAYALAGRVDFDFAAQPICTCSDGTGVYLADLWPEDAEVAEVLGRVVDADLYAQGNAQLFAGDDSWNALDAAGGITFAWDEGSAYVRRPPYFDGMAAQAQDPAPIRGARCLAVLGDFITTDHISPAGAIAPDSAAAAYLRGAGVADADFNTYGSRRGNHEVMMRGTFANVKLENALAGGRRGGWTLDVLDGQVTSIFEAAQHYEEQGVPCVVLAGKMYGSGSSRDWAAKGTALLGVRAVFAESYERIHRSNLIGMGVLPLQFADGEGTAAFGLDGSETFDVEAPDFAGPWPQQVRVHAAKPDGVAIDFTATVRIDTPTEAEYYANGGILQFVLRRLTDR